MVVRRRVYFAYQKQLCYRELKVEWPETLTFEAITDVIDELHQKSGKGLSPVLDVSASSPSILGRSYSWSKIMNEDGVKLKDHYVALQETFGDCANEIFVYEYIRHLNNRQLSELRNYRAFTDIYNNPKKEIVSVAEICVLYQLLAMQSKLCYLNNWTLFYCWCNYMLRFERQLWFKSDFEKYESTVPECPDILEQYYWSETSVVHFGL